VEVLLPEGAIGSGREHSVRQDDGDAIDLGRGWLDSVDANPLTPPSFPKTCAFQALRAERDPD
jgi:hypothetical protein